MLSSLLVLACVDGPKVDDTALPADADTDADSDTDSDTDIDTDTDSDSDTDTDTDTSPVACDTPVAVFIGADGGEQDVTSFLTEGTYLTLSNPGTLYVCPGTWFTRVLVRADVSVVGLGATSGDTVLSAGELGTILDVSAANLVVDNVTLDRGAGLQKEHNSGGGGIYCEAYGSVVANDIVFSNNTANDGAGLYATDCESTVTNAVFVDNVSEDDGGAMTVWYSNTTLDNVQFNDNVALDGGALDIFYGSATISNSSFVGNQSGHFAGALWLYNSTLAMSDSTFEGNVNSGGDAGGLLFYGTGTLDRVAFTGNSAPVGGGLYVYWDSVLTATECTFGSNSPDDIWVANYSDAGGESMAGGASTSFACAGSACTAL